MSSEEGGAGRRVLWTVLDQGISSLGNFGLGLLVARSTSAREFGAFAIAYALYLLLVTASRSIASDPLLVRHSDNRDESQPGAIAASTGTAIALGVGLAAATLAAGAVLPSPTGEAVMALAVCIPGLLLQDAWRHVFFANGRPEQAVVNDAIWTASTVLVVLLISASDVDSVGALILAWGGTGGIAGLLGILQTRVRPRPSAAVGWWRRERDLAARFLGEAAVIAGTTNGVLLLLALLGGLHVPGALRAAELLLGPMRLLAATAWSSAVPELVRLRRRSPDAFMSRCALVGGALFIGTGAWGLAAQLLPDRVGELLLGDSWQAARDVLGVVTLDWALIGLAIGAAVGIRALGDARRSLSVRLWIAPLTVVLPLVGVSAGARGAAWGSVAANAVGVVLWWSALRHAVRRSDAVVDGGTGEGWATANAPGS